MEDFKMDDPENFDAQSFWAQLGEDRSINPFDDQMNFDSFDPNYQQRPVDALAPGYQQLALDPLAPEGQQQQPAWPPASPASPAPEAPLSPWQFQQSPLAEGYGMNGQLPSRSYDGLMPGTTIGFDMMFDIPDGLDYENPTDLMPTTSMTDHNSRYPENGGQGQIGQLKGNTSFPLDPALQNPAMGTPKPLPTTSLTKRAEVEEGTVGQDACPDNVEAEIKKEEASEKRDFAYAFDVVPADLEDPNVLEHLDVIRENLKKIGLADFRFQSTTNTKFFRDGREVSVRRYTLPKRLRQDDKTRLIFMQVFNGNRSYNWKLPGYAYKMVQVFEPRPVFHTTNEDYQGLAGLTEEDGVDGLARFSDPDLNELAAYNPPTAQPFPSPESQHDLDLAVLSAAPEQPVTLPTPRDEVEIPTTQRSRPIPKPDRHVRKNAHGKFECIHPGCDEDQKMFARKCEWNKHMDKHERPYRCAAEGCEKLAGFTYSGGLLRHEREVHQKHGGPRNPLNCPHANCKRFKGKGFSRLENLNEHLRRVHTNDESNGIGGDAEDGSSVAASESGQVLSAQIQFSPSQTVQPMQQQSQVQPQLSPRLSALVPLKRALEEDEDTDLQTEVKRLRQSESELSRTNVMLTRQLEAQRQQAELDAAAQKQEIEAQKRQIMAMMAEMTNMRQQLSHVEHTNDAAALLDDHTFV